ncbi:anti-sigma factor domain-containing protein [Bacillus spongiae]|uniref:Anti-sigma factor domain-containing protein n=1 Tax=Bacillus spongiae TaxID=2683610 RepID=A0ABU8H9M9_9BACI
MKKGIIMEEKKDYLIMMTPCGHFEKAVIQNREYAVGEEILFTSYKEKRQTKSYLTWTKMAGIAALLMLVFTIMQSSLGKDTVYAYVSVDTYPSFELGVNKDFEVIEFIPFNEEAEKFIGEIEDWKYSSLETIMVSAVEYSQKLGYNTDNIIVTAAVKGNQSESSDTVLAEVADIIGIIPMSTFIPVTLDQRNAALESGISTWDYIQQLQKNIKPESQINQAPKDIFKNFLSSPSDRGVAVENKEEENNSPKKNERSVTVPVQEFLNRDRGSDIGLSPSQGQDDIHSEQQVREPEPEPVVPKPEPVAPKPEPEPVVPKPEPEPVVPEPEPVVPEPEPEPVVPKPEPEPVVPEPEPVVPEPEPEPVVPEPEPEPVVPEPEPEPVVPEPEPEPVDPEPEPVDPEPEPEPVDPEPEPEPEPVDPEPEPEPVDPEPEPEPVDPEPEPEPVDPEPEPVDPEPEPTPGECHCHHHYHYHEPDEHSDYGHYHYHYYCHIK